MAVDPNPGLEPGQLFEGKYKIMRELGRGGFGMVYLGYQENMDRQVALKVLKPSAVAAAPSAKERFHREVKIISKLKHPNTVTIHDFGETYDGGLFMVLEFVEGEELKQILRRDGPQDGLRAAQIALQIAKSLSEAHKLGVVHRDLKPANVMLTQFGNERDHIKVLDFGVARLLDPKSNDLTSVGLPEGERELIGTPRYMSPEQVRGEMLTGASDIYGLGLILYELVSGEPAVQGETTMALITQQISPEPLGLPAMRGFHPRLQDIIRIATSKRTSERFQTADQMVVALEEFIHQVRAEAAGGSNENMQIASYSNQLQWNGQSQQNWSPGTPSGNYHQPPGSGMYDNHGQTPTGQQSTPNQQYPNQTPSGQFANPQNQQFQQNFVQSGQYPQQQQQGFPQQQQQPFQNQSGNYQHPSGQYPNPSGQFQHQHQSGQFQRPPTGPQPGIELAPSFQSSIPLVDNHEFTPTMERDALDPNIARPQGMFDRNQFPSTELPGGALPPLPEDNDPFAIPESEKKTTSLSQVGEVTLASSPDKKPTLEEIRRRPPPRQMTGNSVPKLVGGVLIAVLGAYIGFICVGALLGTVIDSIGLRLLLSALIVPVLPAIGAAMSTLNSSERVRVSEPFIVRLTKGLFSTAVFCLGAALLCGVLLANRVIPNLYGEPNWFLAKADSTEGIGKINTEASKWIAEAFEGVAAPIGTYDKTSREQKLGPVRTPPATRDKGALFKGRTRPKTPPPTRLGNEQKKAPKSTIKKKKSKDDYVDW